MNGSLLNFVKIFKCLVLCLFMLKKIGNKHEIAKGKQRNQIIVGIILIGLMVVSTAGYAFLDNKKDVNSQTREYNGLQFVKSGQFWTTTIQGQTFYFSYLPEELGNVSISGDYSLGNYSQEPLYFVNNNFASQEVVNNIGRYVLRYQDACLDKCSDLPQKSCADNLIIFMPGGESKVWKEENCVYLSGDSAMAADTFVYRLLGIK